MHVTYKFDLEQRVVDRATKLEGSVVMVGADEHGILYEVAFDTRIQGRRRHFRRESELKLAPKPRKSAS